jgi:hypothetical protein
VHVTVCCDAGLSALAKHVCMRMQHCILSHACIAALSAILERAVLVDHAVVQLVIDTSLALKTSFEICANTSAFTL